VPELERMLTQLGRELDYPKTPDLAGTVAARLRELGSQAAPAAPTARARRLPRLLPPAGLRRSLALALIALLVLAGTVFAAVPGVRDAVLEFFGLRGATVERREMLPEVPRVRPLRLGERVSLAEASKSLSFTPLVPATLGPPDAVYVRRGVPGGEVSLAYKPRPGLPEARSTKLGLLLGEFRGDLAPEYIGKVAPQTTKIERLRVDGARAIWIEGAPHFFFYRAPGSAYGVTERSLRLAANVLLLEGGRMLVRLEGAFDRERAVVIARSLR